MCAGSIIPLPAQATTPPHQVLEDKSRVGPVEVIQTSRWWAAFLVDDIVKVYAGGLGWRCCHCGGVVYSLEISGMGSSKQLDEKCGKRGGDCDKGRVWVWVWV